MVPAGQQGGGKARTKKRKEKQYGSNIMETSKNKIETEINQETTRITILIATELCWQVFFTASLQGSNRMAHLSQLIVVPRTGELEINTKCVHDVTSYDHA